jgi:hypothetical protein
MSMDQQREHAGALLPGLMPAETKWEGTALYPGPG